MYLTHNESKSVVAGSFISTLKGKIYYLNKLVNEYSNTYHCYIGKKFIHAYYSILPEEIESSYKSPKFKAGLQRVTKYKNIFSKGYTKNWSKEIFQIDFLLKTYPWTYQKI